ncbi:hypothetical protein CHLNCDRAFT_142079 [Chlorella variabilis]|uniref:Uncharacterized protein n=1 Tax=Chlorella variabilis TaxID=554065 RepID=E1Z7Q2_CHLVA|nr:hypothetical protein CHLNCDRAFT_142079 [Chlorella variabilis]EFN58211.1 hypothetical protein CHLNCDRAFT_142079 [Chlorella variabilis]|eukprot:XP_005850313.1 hypothetical protein CHLNCDRAFT_142079 [Chlorella variabilis]
MAAYGGLVTVLRALLSCRLPLDLSTRDRLGRSLQVLAVGGTSAPENMQATVRLLHAAGAPLEADALLHAVDRRCGAGVEALLACGRPAVDTSRSWLAVFGRDRYSCPVHRVLQGLAMQASCGFPILPEEEREAVRILEALLAAGFRPTVYRQVAQGPFRHSSDTRVRAEFDPFTGDPTYSKLGTRQVGVGAGHSPA